MYTAHSHLRLWRVKFDAKLVGIIEVCLSLLSNNNNYTKHGADAFNSNIFNLSSAIFFFAISVSSIFLNLALAGG